MMGGIDRVTMITGGSYPDEYAILALDGVPVDRMTHFYAEWDANGLMRQMFNRHAEALAWWIGRETE